MFVKEVSTGHYVIFLDEKMQNWIGFAERIEREWYFESKQSLGGKWAFGLTIMDAIEQTGVLKRVRIGENLFEKEYKQ